MDLTHERYFLRTMISSFSKILAFNAPGYFGEMYSQKVWKANSAMVEKIDLTLQGTMVYLYIYVYKEQFPKSPTPEQQQKINEVWIAMGHPENVINV
jgi:hypothetical protein